MDEEEHAEGATADVGGPELQTLVGRFWLVVTKGPDAGATHTSVGERTVIGTHPSVDWVLNDSAVSRFHCELVPREGKVLVRDLQSRNGTSIDGTQIESGFARNGARLTLGRTEIQLELRADKTQVPLSKQTKFGKMVGSSSAMRAVFALLERAAPGDATVLIEGETGTGKELAAESIHQESARRDGPFVVVDCGAIQEELLESELFGHERGSFTGAHQPREGALRAASGGTLFLDEIGELSLDLQPKLLRALERREVKPVGSDTYEPIDVRVVAATNRNLRAEVNERRFRSDLYYRIAVVEVRLPPLRERRDDIPALATHLYEELGGAPSEFAEPRFLSELSRHAWPGNVRELRNYLERCLTLREQLPIEVNESLANDVSIEANLPLKLARERWTRAFEKRYVAILLERHGGNVRAAAQEAGVDRMHFYRLSWRYGLK